MAGWNCQHCTYHHHADAHRCVMCGELRVSRQQMADFVRGIPITEPAVPTTDKSSLGPPAATKQSRIDAWRPVNNPYNRGSADVLPSQPAMPAPPSATRPASRPLASSHQSDMKPPAPVITLAYRPGPVPLDPTAANDWIYPLHTDYPKRDYQFEIASTALFQNTLVSLPTGLGKTLIAAVVLYNYHRWFPSGKVLFCAPTLPLVNQQVKAVYDICGVPAESTAVLTGRLTPDKRSSVWQSRSVFFCTPQTVQRDLESDRCPASQVVCVVFDEAHKATGDYAYVKVVELLEQASAKFRVVGLSATPGSNIKAIQSVVEALRINRIESRCDDDPDIQQYTHGRSSEIILVPQASASREIERALAELIHPLLDKLRAAGAKLHRNATVTAYTIMKAKDDYCAQHGPQGTIVSVFFAAFTFVQHRDWLHKHGVGMVRMKLVKLRNEPQRGVMSTIVKGREFSRYWDEVMAATVDPDSSTAKIQDRLANNPKLTKLREILVEHFERARACGTSSRAIVFSQFRDSVSEIVSILKSSEPLIRPRHFIGQGKGSSKAEGSAAQLKGMKQAEQHQVIREFRNDVHNVLVCTCIGEEGLDIGEVDLIVNFDTLRNPIRMIQRVGRTGRKRQGRVLSLVAEGQEERTLSASRSSSRTLVHALRNPKSFKCFPTMPMFPVEPTLTEKIMADVPGFRATQVEGHGGQASRPQSERSLSAPSRKGWKLSDEQELQRVELLGRHGRLRSEVNQPGLEVLRRRFLMAKSSRGDATKVGRTAAIVRAMEGACPISATSTRKLRGEDAPSGRLFPLAATDFSDAKHDGGDSSTTQQATTCAVRLAVDGAKECDQPKRLRSAPSPTTKHAPVAADPSDRSAATTAAASSDTPSGISTVDQPLYTARQESPWRPEVPVRSDGPIASVDPSVLQRNSESVERHSIVGQPEGNDEFVLPTPPDTDSNSSCSGDEEIEGKPSTEPAVDVCMGGKGPEVDHPVYRNGHRNDDALVSHVPMQLADDEFRLPTQEESSDESDDDDLPLGALAQTGVNDPSKPFSRVRFSLEAPIVFDVVAESTDSSRNAALGDNQSSRDTDALIQHEKGRKVLAIADTQASDGEARFGTDTPAHGQKRRLSISDLMDTQNSKSSTDRPYSLKCADDVVCAVCKDGQSPDDNPIILCDGPSEGIVCDIAVHMSCYAINRSEIEADADWRCDPCFFRYTGGTGIPRCRVCCGEGGILRQETHTLWKHIACNPNRNRKLKRLRKKEPARATKHKDLKRPPFQHVSDNQQGARDPPGNKRRIEVQRFFDDEAGIQSDDDLDDDEEAELRALEEEENSFSSFINDSSQLGFTQDDLDRIEPEIHGVFDASQHRQREFDTPLLSRRAARRKQTGVWTQTQESAPSSEKGLGNMHFIRSVLEHHRQGGRAEEIEQVYQALEAAGTPLAGQPHDESP